MYIVISMLTVSIHSFSLHEPKYDFEICHFDDNDDSFFVVVPCFFPPNDDELLMFFTL